MGNNENIAVAHASERRIEGVSFSVLAKDVATVGSGTLFAAVFNTLLVFLIPRLVSVEDFGYWRLFLLYTTYAGLLHLGLADGALLQWAGKPLEDVQEEVTPCLKFMFWQHLALIVPSGLTAVVVLPSPMGLIAVAILGAGLLINLATVFQFGFQAARKFFPVAVVTAAPPGVFLILVFLWELHGIPSFRQLIALYCAAWAVTLVYLRTRAGGDPVSGNPGSVWALGKTFILLGWPVLLSNTCLNVVQSADRLVVSSTLPIYEFAQYSLAGSVMFVPVTAIAAIYRVFFSHVAAVEQGGRAKVYEHASSIVVLTWSLLLPYFFVLDAFLRRFIPKYVPALPVAGILLIGVIFLAGVQVLHMSYFCLYGRQRQFLALTICALILSVSTALLMVKILHSLAAVAVGQVVSLACWWLANEWTLRDASGQEWKDWARILGLFLWSAGGYGLALWLTPLAGFRLAVYYLVAIPGMWLACRQEIQLGWGKLRAA